MPAPLRPRTPDFSARGSQILLFFLLAALPLGSDSSAAARPSEGGASRRATPIVRAVRGVADSVVNIQGQKSVASETGVGAARQVNGMGTGVVIDPRGYILTNFHVVDGVRQINVTLSQGQQHVAQLAAHDRETDLAVIRISVPQSLPVAPLGTSSDLMTGETVIAVGNAFGYEHTVTTGIISALHRNVQVNETQQYLDLIQTDASINPGNSGGPLLNIDGEMIGVNVAVRAGAQGIGFAIPVDKALDVAARLMSIERLERHWHGMTPLAVEGPLGPVTVVKVDQESPARASGVQSGDQLEQIGSLAIDRPMDVERALLGVRVGEEVPVVVRRGNRTVRLEMTVAALPRSLGSSAATRVPSSRSRESQQISWETFGMELEAEPRSTFQTRGMPFQGGMRVTRVRPGSSAAEQGVLEGDLLVKIHRWTTTSDQDVRYIANWAASNAKLGQVRFDIVRGDERFFGHLALQTDDAQRR